MVLVITVWDVWTESFNNRILYNIVVMPLVEFILLYVISLNI